MQNSRKNESLVCFNFFLETKKEIFDKNQAL